MPGDVPQASTRALTNATPRRTTGDAPLRSSNSPVVRGTINAPTTPQNVASKRRPNCAPQCRASSSARRESDSFSVTLSGKLSVPVRVNGCRNAPLERVGSPNAYFTRRRILPMTGWRYSVICRPEEDRMRTSHRLVVDGLRCQPAVARLACWFVEWGSTSFLTSSVARDLRCGPLVAGGLREPVEPRPQRSSGKIVQIVGAQLDQACHPQLISRAAGDRCLAPVSRVVLRSNPYGQGHPSP